MSIGYIPKKLKHARRQKRMRKKYKNFSCITCMYKDICITNYSYHGETYNINLEFCCGWEPSYEAKKGKMSKSCSEQEKKQCIF